MWQLCSSITSRVLVILLLSSINTKTIAENTQTSDRDDNIRALLPQSCVFSSNFEQEKKSQKRPFPLKSSGSIFFHCERGLIWENESPFLEETIFTSKKANFRLVPNEPVEQLEGPKYDYLSSLLLSILSADIAAIDDKFTLHLKNKNQITLTPKNKTISKRLLSIDIEKNSNTKNESLSISIKTQKNQTTKISITNIINLGHVEPSNHTNYRSCLSSTEIKDSSKESCNILRNPKKYIRLDISDKK